MGGFGKVDSFGNVGGFGKVVLEMWVLLKRWVVLEMWVVVERCCWKLLIHNPLTIQKLSILHVKTSNNSGLEDSNRGLEPFWRRPWASWGVLEAF